MTTIAYDGNTLTADGRATVGQAICKDDKEKIKVVVTYCQESGKKITTYYACAGRHDALDKYLSTGDMDSHSHILEIQDGVCTVLYDGSRFVTDIPVAIGSGWAFAEGAMLAGSTSKDAVKIAAKKDSCTGGKIKTIKVRK